MHRSRRLLPVLIALSLLLTGASCGEQRDSDALELPKAEKVDIPAAPDLRTPESAVRSYLDWVSYAYATAVSDSASLTADSYEMVRVDSYIQLNREQSQCLYQRLESLETSLVSVSASDAVVTARETWRYRYFSIVDNSWIGPVHRTSYEATYTLVPPPAGSPSPGPWIVFEVRADPLDEVF
ncbi:MAG: hypothetical protein FDZ70_07835 [Actinobacteria bacterium]|nr:MAG: hypothetical protein FDZ70_07835 [Actinomycetota bacterium]